MAMAVSAFLPLPVNYPQVLLIFPRGQSKVLLSKVEGEANAKALLNLPQGLGPLWMTEREGNRPAGTRGLTTLRKCILFPMKP